MSPSTSFVSPELTNTVREATTRWLDLPDSSSFPITLSSPPREVTLAAAKAAREARAAAREAARRERAKTRLVVLGIWSVAVVLAGVLAFFALGS